MGAENAPAAHVYEQIYVVGKRAAGAGVGVGYVEQRAVAFGYSGIRTADARADGAKFAPKKLGRPVLDYSNGARPLEIDGYNGNGYVFHLAHKRNSSILLGL